MTLLQPDLRPLTARDISYAYSAKSRPARAFIRLMENSTGRLGLMKRATGYEDDMARGMGFFDVMVQRYGLTLDVVGGSLANIPETGPVIALANHPYGILDGLMLGHMLARRRDGFKIMAHSVFNRAPDLNRHLLPISFDEDKAALARRSCPSRKPCETSWRRQRSATASTST